MSRFKAYILSGSGRGIQGMHLVRERERESQKSKDFFSHAWVSGLTLFVKMQTKTMISIFWNIQNYLYYYVVCSKSKCDSWLTRSQIIHHQYILSLGCLFWHKIFFKKKNKTIYLDIWVFLKIIFGI